MATDWASDVKTYAPDADGAVIAGIVRYCGIALQKVDSSLVSFSDPKELARVRENFLKKKCALTHPDAELDAAIAEVGARMKDDRTKNRVTVYYLLSDKFGKHDLFVKAVKAPAARSVTGAVKRAAPVVGKIAPVKGGPSKAKASPKAGVANETVAKPAASRPAKPATVATAAPARTPAVTPTAPVPLADIGPATGRSTPLGSRLSLGAKSDGSGSGLLWFALPAAAILGLFAMIGLRG